MFSIIVVNMTTIKEYIIANGIYNYVIFVTNDKKNVDVWINSHVVMASHICDLGLQYLSFIQSYLTCFDTVA
jgi:hypothetical protein